MLRSGVSPVQFLRNFQDLWTVLRSIKVLNWLELCTLFQSYAGLTSGKFSQNFQCLLAAKLYIGSKNVFEVQKWYRHHHAE